MSPAQILTHIGASSLLLVGLGHTVTELLMGNRPAPREVAPILEQMKQAFVVMPGRRVSLHQLLRGFSLMMGACLVTLGVLLNLAAWEGPTLAPLGIGAALSTVGLFISVRYLFAIPIAFTAVSLLSFLGALMSAYL